MKNLKTYIIENLKGDVVKWFTNIYTNMIKLVKENKLETIDPDVQKLSKPTTGAFPYKDFKNTNVIKRILANNNFGFVVTNQMFTNPNKYISKQENDQKGVSQCECLPYWYKLNDTVYFVGLIVYDIGMPDLKEYCNILSIESALNISDSKKLLQGMLNDFANNYIKDKGNYQGLSIAPIHPKMQAICLKLGFKKVKENNNILIYKI